MRLYSSNMHDAPQLKNPTWGDFNKVFNYILDDSVDWTCTSVETIDDTLIKIKYDTATIKLIEGQSIIVSNTANYNKEYLIIEITTDGAYCKNLSIIKGTLSEIGTFKFKRPACGLKRLYGGVSDQRTVVQFKSGCVMRVDDRPIGNLLTPNVTWLDTWHNFARVAIAEGSNGIDNLFGRQMPYLDTEPTLNIIPNGKNVGNALIIYTIGAYNTLRLNEVVTNKSSDDIEWFILADEEFIVVTIKNSIGNKINRTYFFGDVLSNNTPKKYDQILYAVRATASANPSYDVDWNKNTRTNNIFMNNSTSSNSNYMNVNNVYSGNFYESGGIQTSAGIHISGSSNAFLYINNQVIHTDTFFTRGTITLTAISKKLRYVSTILDEDDKNFIFGKPFTDIDGDIYIFLVCYYGGSAINSVSNSRYLVKLDIPFK